MIRRILAICVSEFIVALRNRWVLTAILLMAVFSTVLTFAGSSPVGSLGVDLLTVAVASMTTLSVYLVPLLALLLAFDGIAGEIERGGLALLLTYPVSRVEVLLGKMLAHLVTLTLAVTVGFGLAGSLAWAAGGAGTESAFGLFRLGWSSVLLGMNFLALGYAASATTRSAGAAAGAAVGLWIVFVVIYDLALLGALVADKGGTFTTHVFPFALAANPADAFRVFNLSMSENAAIATGIGVTGKGVPLWLVFGSMAVWPLLGLALAHAVLKRIEP